MCKSSRYIPSNCKKRCIYIYMWLTNKRLWPCCESNKIKPCTISTRLRIARIASPAPLKRCCQLIFVPSICRFVRPSSITIRRQKQKRKRRLACDKSVCGLSVTKRLLTKHSVTSLTQIIPLPLSPPSSTFNNFFHL